MFKKILWIIGIIILILGLIGISYYLGKSAGLFSTGDVVSKCQDTTCCKNSGYDSCQKQFDESVLSTAGGMVARS